MKEPAMLLAALMVLLPLASAGAQELRDHGVGTPLAERRGVVGVHTDDGQNLVIACSTDLSPRGWILVTDIDTGETEQIYGPPGVPNGPPYGSLVASTGRFYTGFGDWLLEFDPITREWTAATQVPPASAFLRIIEGPNGLIWAGDVYRAGLASYDPATGKLTDHGRMDEKEQYLSHLAYDDAGWLYCGIGTGAHKIVAYNPESGERRQIVPEDELEIGTAYVQTGVDGNAYGRAGEQWYRLHGGVGEKIDQSEVAQKRDLGDIYWGDVDATFPDGREVTTYSLLDKFMIVRDPAAGEERRIEFDYQSEGSGIRVVCAGPDGRIYANSAHPSRFIVYDPDSDTLRHMPDAIALKGLAVQGPYVAGGHYGGGKLYIFDTRRPWRMHPRAGLIEGGLGAEQLAERATADLGEVRYLDSHDIVFLLGDQFGAELHMPVTVPTDGEYRLIVATYTSPAYARGQILLDGEPVGEPFDPRSPTIGPGPVLVFGPFDLSAGEHTVSVRTLNGDAENPWISIASLKLTDEPVDPATLQLEASNPQLVAEFAPDINVPWGAAAHPDGEHVMISGNPGYGYIGGGLGIHNIVTGENELLPHTRLVENQSTMDIAPLPDGDLICCTSVSGGHGAGAVTRDAMLYRLDWESRQVEWRAVPVPGLASIVSLEVAPDGTVWAIGSDATLIVFDPETQEVVRTVDLGVYGAVPHQPITRGPDGMLYLLLGRSILRIDPRTHVIEKIVDAPGGISGGIGILDGRIYFSIDSHLWSAAI